MYVLTDGRGGYIRFDDASKKYVLVRSRKFAKVWESREKAENVLKNCLPRKQAAQFRVEDAGGAGGIARNAASREERKTPPALCVAEQIASEPYDRADLDRWQELVGGIGQFADAVAQRREQLSRDMSGVDREISDIQHYIELNELNACQGYLAYKMLQNKLRKRRQVKNEMRVLDKIDSEGINPASIGAINAEFNNVKNQAYSPRRLPQLFG